jgi:tRNA threonylcarbamoyladenosine biosynthesis protein TsaB
VRSLDSILQAHRSALLIDASSATLHAGWLAAGETPRWATVRKEAGTGLYDLLAQLKLSPNDAGAFIFCEGPGSMLGIRTVATALRTWTALARRPIYRYRTLDLLAHTAGQPGRTFICDARRRSWHALTIAADGTFEPIRRLATADLPAGDICMPEGFRSWTPLPSPAPTLLSYNPSLFSTELRNVACLESTHDPDAYQPERPTYAKWTPQVHQAPNA